MYWTGTLYGRPSELHDPLNSTVRNCTFENIDGYALSGRRRNCEISQNRFSDCKAIELDAQQGNAANKSTNNLIAGNVFDAVTLGLYVYWATVASTHANEFRDNLFIGTATKIYEGSAAGTSVYWRNNRYAAGGSTGILATNNGFTLNDDLSSEFDAHESIWLPQGVKTGIVAVNPGAQGDGPLTAWLNIIATCGTANDAVTMPAAVGGREVIIVNNGTQTLEIWPAAGDNLGSGVDTAQTLTAGSNRRYVAYDTTNWETV